MSTAARIFTICRSPSRQVKERRSLCLGQTPSPIQTTSNQTARVARPVALAGEIEVEQGGDRPHEGPPAFADHDAPPVPEREAVLLEPQQSVGRGRLQRRRVGAMFGRDGEF